MKNIALLTCDKLEEFVTDEDPLSEFIVKDCGWPTEWVSWSQDVKWQNYSHAIVRTTWDYTLQREQFLSTLKKIEDLGVQLLNSYKIIEWNSHKKYLMDLQVKGVQICETIDLDQRSVEEVYNIVKKWPQLKVLLKPFVGAASKGIEFFENSEQGVKKLVDSISQSSENWFLQPFYEEISEGEISIVYFNKKISHAIKKVPKVGDFRSQEEYGSEILTYEPSPMEIQFGNQILELFEEPLLYARVDFINHLGRPHLMELELIEPALYFRTHKNLFSNFTKALKVALRSE